MEIVNTRPAQAYQNQQLLIYPDRGNKDNYLYIGNWSE